MKHLRIMAAVALFATATPVAAQQSLEVYGGIGYTGTDAEGFALTDLSDWNKMMQVAYGQYFFFDGDRVRIGAEIGYQYLFWYQWFDGFSNNETGVDAYRFMGVIRTDFTPAIFGEATAGFYNFGSFTDLAIGAAVGGYIPISERWSIPVKVRMNMILDSDANMLPIGIDVGFAYDFGSE